MFTIPFFCPVCDQMADAMADPIGLLFAGKGYVLECTTCKTKYNADIQVGAVGQTTTLKGQLEQEDEE